MSTLLLTGNKEWLDAMQLDADTEFEPDVDGWLSIFERVDMVVEKSGLKGRVGSSLHFNPHILPFLEQLGIEGELLNAIERYSKKNSFELGIHAHHADDDIIGSSRFPLVFRDDIEIASRFHATSLVEHPPVGTQNTIQETVDLLTSDWFCKLLEENPGITIAWENKADYSHKRRFFGSLARMVEFRETLSDRLHEIGKDEIAGRHQFCFDTGHLLIYRGTAESKPQVDREIEDYLPKFSKHVKVFHFQANDGIIDGHVAPFSTQFFNHPSRTRMDLEKMLSNYDILKDWISICNNTAHVPNRHLFLECGTLPFSLEQYIEFGKELALLL
ncbi:MAG: hypothetical protein ACTSU9_11520 [Promethearchaeota archaeon]